MPALAGAIGVAGLCALLAAQEAGAAESRATPPEPQPAARSAVASARRWACFYGQNLSEASWRSLQLAVVDPDHFKRPASSGAVALAYLSLGEADERRAFWPQVKGKPYLVEPNPDWPGAHRVDVRSPEWRKLLLERVAPDALRKGYAGFLLDTVDTAEYFESSAPVRFAGSLDAAAAFIRALREARPAAPILMNNGLALLPAVESFIDGLVVEDVYTRCIASSKACRPSPDSESRAKEARLKEFSARTGKPVFVLLYAFPSERGERWVATAVRRALAAGFRPYLASPSLERLGVVAPAGKP